MEPSANLIPPTTELSASDLETDLKNESALETVASETEAVRSTVSTPTRSLWFGVIPAVLLSGFVGLTLLLDQSARGPALPPPTPSPTNTHSPSTAPELDTLPSLIAPPPSEAMSPTGQAHGTPAPRAVPPQVGTSGSLPQGAIPLGAPTLGAPATPNAAAHSPARGEFESGEAALRANKPDEAKKHYEAALTLDPQLAPAHLRLAALATKPEEAISHLEMAAQLAPADATPRLQLSVIYEQMRQPVKAETWARDAVKVATGPTKHEAQNNLGHILVANGKTQEAYDHWVALAKANPRDGEAALSAGLIAREKLKKPQEAARYINQALKAPLDDPQFAALLSEVLIGDKRVTDADRLLTQATKKFPTFIPLHTGLAELRVKRGDTKGAISIMRGIISRVPRTVNGGAPLAQLHIELAQILAIGGQAKPALQEAQAAVTLRPKDAPVQAFLAELFLRTGDPKNGITALRRLIQLDPKKPQPHRLLAHTLAQTRQFAAAEKEYQTFIKMEPDDLSAQAELADLHEIMGHADQALDIWNQLAKKKPDLPLPALQQGRILDAAGKSSQALERYRYVLHLAPNEPNALLGAAKIEEKNGEDMRALAHLKAVVSTQPRFDGVYEALARVAKKKNQMPATVNFLKQELGKNPDRRGAYAMILDFYEANGQVNTGRDYVLGYIKKFPKLTAPRQAIDTFDLRRAKQMLSDLEKADKNKPTAKPESSTTPNKPAESPDIPTESPKP